LREGVSDVEYRESDFLDLIELDLIENRADLIIVYDPDCGRGVGFWGFVDFFPTEACQNFWVIPKRNYMGMKKIYMGYNRNSFRLKRKIAAWDDDFLASLIAAAFPSPDSPGLLSRLRSRARVVFRLGASLVLSDGLIQGRGCRSSELVPENWTGA
jgi:hypothetical protein